MYQIAPPSPPPRVALADDNGSRRVRLRLWQLLMTFVTVLVTAWFCTFGIVPAVAALMIAKHILVAVLMVGLDAERNMPAEPLPGSPYPLG